MIFERRVPRLFYQEMENQPGQLVHVYSGQSGSFIVMLHFGGFHASMQTTREGVEAVRDACNLALIHEEPSP